MSYDLVYAIDGHELIFMADTLDEVNAEIRKLYDEGKNINVLNIEEHRDGPRTWAIEYPPAPPAGTRVMTKRGLIYTLGEKGSVDIGGTVYSWKGFVEEHGPLTEVVETEVEAAARRLRERGWARPKGPVKDWDDLQLVLAHVLNGGTL